MNASKTKWVGVLVAVGALVGCGAEADVSSQEPTQAEEELSSAGRQKAEIVQLLARYETALNANDVPAVVDLYTDDSVLLPGNTPTVAGIQAVEQFYTGTFQAIDLDLKFHVAEVVVSNDLAYLRSNSTGTIKIVATATNIPSANQELFVLRKHAGHWKFARYAFSSTLPAQ